MVKLSNEEKERELQEAELKELRKHEWYDQPDNRQYMEGFFDYKNLMINPASVNMKIKVKEMDPKNIDKYFKQLFTMLNRDMQLGNLNPYWFNIVSMHVHLATELIRVKAYTAGAVFLQKAFMYLIMSNSQGGKLRVLESSMISVRKLETSKGQEKGGWHGLGRRKKERR